MKARTDTSMTPRQVSDVLSPVYTVRDEIADVNPDAAIAVGLDEALIGYTVGGEEHVAVYDMDKCIEILMKTHDCNEEDAEDFFSYNVLRGADYCCDENAPVFVRLPK